MYKLVFLFAGIILLMSACSNRNHVADAYGNFEATDIIISSEASGTILNFKIEEGQELKKDDTVGLVDTIQLYLKKKQLAAQRKMAATKDENLSAQIDVLKEQKKNLLIDKNRIDKLFKDGAATAKQVDDINGNIQVVDKQIETVKTQNPSVFNELQAYTKQIDQIEDQIKKSIIINPVNGTVLEKYVEPHEMAVIGKLLYKIADLSKMYLRVYISGSQLPNVKIGQKVEVLIDKDEKDYRKLEGEISWISSQTEFTPKIIQTKEERVNMVYAMKVFVKNDGSLKIGMPGEVNFTNK